MHFFVNVVNDPPGLPVVKNPGDMSWVAGTVPAPELLGGTDPDDANVTWLFEIYEDSAMTQKLLEHQDGLPVFQLTSDDGLAEQNWYFWHIKAVDSSGKESAWSEPASFFTTRAQGDEEYCFDTDGDGDVDGLDLADFARSGSIKDIRKMALSFGVSADLDNDGDVDGKDVAELAAHPDMIDMKCLASGFGSSR